MPDRCPAPGCPRPATRGGYCRRHAHQVATHGRLTPDLERAPRGPGRVPPLSVPLNREERARLAAVAAREQVGQHALARRLVVEGIERRERGRRARTGRS